MELRKWISYKCFQQVIIFNFREFELGPDCLANALLYFDGNTSNIASQRFCGNQPVWIASSTGHVVVFQLIQGSNYTGSRFRLDYSTTRSPRDPLYPVMSTGEKEGHACWAKVQLISQKANLTTNHCGHWVVGSQGWFYVCAQPMRDVLTK